MTLSAILNEIYDVLHGHYSHLPTLVIDSFINYIIHGFTRHGLRKLCAACDTIISHKRKLSSFVMKCVGCFWEQLISFLFSFPDDDVVVVALVAAPNFV